MPDARTIVEKADLAVSNLVNDGGYLNPEQSNKFLDIIIDQPTLLNSVRTVRMSAPQRKIEKIGFGSRIMNAAPASGSYLDSANRSKPDLQTVSLSTKEVMAEVWIPYDVLEDNIEHGGMEDTIMRHMASRIALDLEELLIQGDQSLDAGDPYLDLIDGALLMSGNALVDCTGKGYGSDLWKALIAAMPTKYLRDLNAMRFYGSYNTEHEYRDVLAARETGLGDAGITGRNSVYGFGVQLTPCALMPNGNVLFTYPQNIIWGVQRDIMIETDRDIRARVIQIVVTMRIDFKAETSTAIVVGENVGAV
jgi:hypothetical protein